MTELMIPFDDKSAPLYEQIYRFIKEEIVSGRIPAQTKLPSTRRLAVNLSVSRTTVQLAYDQLTAEGYLEPEPCRGYFSADVGVLLQMYRTGSDSKAANPDFQEEEEKPLVDFSPRGIDLEHFP